MFSFAEWGNASPEKKVVDGVTYYILEAQPSAVKIIWKDRKGTQLRTFPAAVRYLAGEGVIPSTLMNGKLAVMPLKVLMEFLMITSQEFLLF